MPDASPDVVIIGAGVVGSAIALELSRLGYRTTNIDANAVAGAGSTSSSSACVRFHYSTWDAVLTAWESHRLWASWGEHLDHVDEAGMATFVETGALVIDAPPFPTD